MPQGICGKHDKTMERIFAEINEIKIQNTAIVTKMDDVASFKESIKLTIFGNGKEGLVTKVSRLFTQVNLQWTLVLLIIGSIIGYFLKR